VATYRYLVADARTGTYLEELPMTAQTFSQVINGAGALTATLPLTDLGTLDWRGLTTENRTLLIVYRDDAIVWGGIIMKRRPINSGMSAELSAETLEGYLSRRRIKTDNTYSGDLFDVVRSIITLIQAVTGGNVGIIVTAGTSGQTLAAPITYTGTDRTHVLDAIQRLAELQPGFEFTITWGRTGNVFAPTLNLAAPGLSNGVPAIVLEFPGNLADYDYPEDGAARPNALTGVGQTVAGAPLTYEVVDTLGQIAAGYPIFEDEWQAKEEADFGRLQSRTATQAAAVLADYVIPTVTVRGDADLQFGGYPLGVACRLRLTSPYHPATVNGSPGVEVTRRVTGWTVTPTPVEKVALTLGSTTGKILLPARAKTPAQRLAELAARVAKLEAV
jgi:hypothetical protein